MRINYCKAPAASNIINCHVGNECRLTGPGFSDYVGVFAPVWGREAEDRIFILELCLCKEVNVVLILFFVIVGNRQILGSLSGEGFAPRDVFDAGKQQARRVPEGCQLLGV